jgi:hypothetical protein
LRALALYAQYVDLDFEDCLSVAHMEQLAVQQIYSYDEGIDRVDQVARLEPEIQQGEKRGVVQSDHPNITAQVDHDE